MEILGLGFNGLDVLSHISQWNPMSEGGLGAFTHGAPSGKVGVGQFGGVFVDCLFEEFNARRFG